MNFVTSIAVFHRERSISDKAKSKLRDRTHRTILSDGFRKRYCFGYYFHCSVWPIKVFFFEDLTHGNISPVTFPLNGLSDMASRGSHSAPTHLSTHWKKRLLHYLPLELAGFLTALCKCKIVLATLWQIETGNLNKICMFNKIKYPQLNN